MVNQILELIDWIIMDLNNIKIKRACKLLGINTMEICSIDKQDFLDKTFGKNNMKECIEYLLRLKKMV